jgi:dihydrofolate reductase
MKDDGQQNVMVISDNISENINKIKQQGGKNILIFGSPSASNALLQKGLVDEFWIFVNPVLLGQGIPLFKDITESVELELIETRTFNMGVIALHYSKV